MSSSGLNRQMAFSKQPFYLLLIYCCLKIRLSFDFIRILAKNNRYAHLIASNISIYVYT